MVWIKKKKAEQLYRGGKESDIVQFPSKRTAEYFSLNSTN